MRIGGAFVVRSKERRSIFFAESTLSYKKKNLPKPFDLNFEIKYHIDLLPKITINISCTAR